MTDHPLADEFLLKLLKRNESGDPVIGGMHLKSRLGSGAMGAVFKGHHPRMNVAVAVKILAPNQGSRENNERAARWFQREAQLLWQVQSTNVVRVTDVGQDDESGLQYMVMDYVRGMTAAAFVEAFNNFMLQPTTTVAVAHDDAGAAPTWQNGLDEAIAVRICLAAARGLEAIHENNIIHRDIKPDNILIPYRADYTREHDLTQLDFDKTQLVDLGVARQADESATTQQGMIVGTPAFMAPEQARGDDPCKASDVYSLGTTLYYLLAGRPPFMAKAPHAVVVKVLTEEPPPIEQLVPRLSKSTRAVLLKCMHKNVADRYADGRALRRALEQATAELPTAGAGVEMFSLPALSAVTPAVPKDAMAAPPPVAPVAAPDSAGDAVAAATAATVARPATRKHPPVPVKTGPKTTRSKLPPVTGAGAESGTPPTGVRKGTAPQKPVTARGKTGKTAPVAAAARPAEPGVFESANYLPTEGDPLRREKEALQAAEREQALAEEVRSTWAAIPIAAWGGLTVAGCFLNGLVAVGVLWLLVTVAAAALPFIQRGRFKRPAVIVSVMFSLLGWLLVDQVGGFLTSGLGRVFGSDAAVAAGLATSVNDWLGTGVLALVTVLSLISLYHMTRYFLDEKKRRTLAAERARLKVK